MKTTTIVAAVTALAFSLSNVALAQSDADRDQQATRASQAMQSHGNQGHREQAPQARGNQRHRAAPPQVERHRPGPPDRQAHEGRGAGPDHNFYRGGRLPPEYHNRQYVVDDWRAHHLSAPPRGYHWVQAGSDYVLVAITTGIILSILLNN
ncbi:MAG: RcnB family protein [Caldimonas sp.]